MILEGPVRVCDTCRRVTERFCVFCGKDGCDEHLYQKLLCSLAYGNMREDGELRFLGGKGSPTGDWVCKNCEDILFPHRADVEVVAVLNQTWIELVKIFKARWAARALENDDMPF